MNEKDEEKRIALAHSLAIKERRFVLFCGSGVSKDAEVPTGWDILLETLKRLRYYKEGIKLDYSHEQMESYYNENYKDLTYSGIIKQLFPCLEDQRTFLQSLFEGKEPGLGHKLVAQWVKEGLIKFIITTNFDNLLEKALEDEGLENKYSKISSGEEAINSEPWPHVELCRIYKIHGTIEKGRIRNTEKDLECLDTEIEKDILRIIDTHGVIVLGYSGSDKAVMSTFEKRELRGLSFYWTIHNNINEQVKGLVRSQNGEFIHIENSSEFLGDIIEKFMFTKEEIKTALKLEAEIKEVTNILKSLYSKQEDLIINEETRIDHLDLLGCQSQITHYSNKLSELNKQKEALK